MSKEYYEVRIGDRFVCKVDHIFMIGLECAPAYDKRKVTLINVTPGGFGGLESNLVDYTGSGTYNLYDITTQAEFLIGEARHERAANCTYDGQYGPWEEVKPREGEVTDGQLLLGICLDDISTQHMFKLVFPNKIQRIHDDEWATIGRAGEYDFSTLSLENIATAIRVLSDRFSCYDFYIPKGLNRLFENSNRMVEPGTRLIGTLDGVETDFIITNKIGAELKRVRDGRTEACNPGFPCTLEAFQDHFDAVACGFRGNVLRFA